MAALLTPRGEDGVVDFEALERNAEFVLARGGCGVVPCGGTGEYFDLSLSERQQIVELLVPVVKPKGLLIVGVGAGALRDSVQLARHALNAGADAVLLPAPHFYHYGGGDLRQFFREAARSIGGPTLIYNLAAFVSPINADLAAELLQSEPHLVGIKDSSGKLDILRRLKADGFDGARLQGHDTRLDESLREGIASGAISGPAGVVPETVAAIFDSFGDEPAFCQAVEHFNQFLRQHERFPYPWAIKWAAQHRGLGQATLPFALSPDQQRSRKQFETWFAGWLGSGQSS